MSEETGINTTFDYSDSFMLQLMAELLRDIDFAVMAIPNLRAEYFEDRKVFKDLFILIQDYYSEIKDIPRTKESLLDHAIDLKEKNKRIDIDDTIKTVIDYIYRRNDDGSYAFITEKRLIHVKTNDFIKRAAMKIAIIEASRKLLMHEDYEGVKKVIMKALTVGISNMGTKVFADSQMLLAEFIKSKEPRARIQTPISILNEKIEGLGRQELFIIVAPPNVGKSLAMVAFSARALLTKRKVVYYTLEMSEMKIAWRLMRSIGQFTTYDLLHSQSIVQEKLNRIYQHISIDLPSETGESVPTQTYKDIVIKQFTSKGCNINTIYSHLSLLETQGFIPDLIVIDYADLMEGPKEYRGDKRNELSAIYTSLRDLAVERNVSVLSASQTNRAALHKDVDIISMEHIAEDFGKNAIADIMISLNQSATDKKDEVFRIFLMKNRDGEAKGQPFKVAVNYDLMSLGDVVGSTDVESALKSM